MPASIKLQEEYGDDLQVIFVECQNTPADTYEAFAWKMKWMGNGAMWTAERPMQTSGQGLPDTALLGVDGKLLLQGHPGDLGKKLKEAIAAEVKKVKDAPEGTPKDVEKAWALFNKGKVASAIAECEKVGGDEAGAAKEEFLARVSAQLQRVSWMIENGHLAAAEDALDGLEKAVDGHAELAGKVAEQATRLEADDLKAEREADKAWAGFVKKVAKGKPFDPGSVKKAEQIAEKHAGTKAAERAERFVALSKIELNK